LKNGPYNNDRPSEDKSALSTRFFAIKEDSDRSEYAAYLVDTDH
jgi:hypothetical protein